MAVDFSDFDRRIIELDKSLEALTDKPDEASKKIAAFLKDNQKFLEAYKKNSHVQRQLQSLAGRVQKNFPDSKIAKRWYEHFQSILKSPLKIFAPEEFTAQIKALKKSISASKGEQMSPDLSKQVKDFVENPRTRDFLRAHQMNPSIGRELLELGIIAKKFPNDPQALRFAENLIELAKEMPLPDEMIAEFIKYVPKENWGNLPKEWNSLSADIKIKWINENQAPLDVLGFKTIQEALIFLKEHGHKLHHLHMRGGFADQFGYRMTNASLREVLSCCPNLKRLKLSYLSITELPPLPVGLEMFGILGADVNDWPPFPEGLQALYLDSRGNNISLQQLPQNLKFLCLNGAGQLPPLPEGLKALVLCKAANNINHALPNGLECLCIIDSNMSQLPELHENLKFLFLIDLPELRQNFVAPRSLQFAKIDKVPVQPQLPAACQANSKKAFAEMANFLEQFFKGGMWLWWGHL